MTTPTIEEIVHEALDNVWENGYNDFVLKLPVTELAQDLVDKCADCEDLQPVVLVLYIEPWRKKCDDPS